MKIAMNSWQNCWNFTLGDLNCNLKLMKKSTVGAKKLKGGGWKMFRIWTLRNYLEQSTNANRRKRLNFITLFQLNFFLVISTCSIYIDQDFALRSNLDLQIQLEQENSWWRALCGWATEFSIYKFIHNLVNLCQLIIFVCDVWGCC